MLRTLWCCENGDVKFYGYADYGDLIIDIHKENCGQFEYLIPKETEKNGYVQLEVVEVF